MHEPLSLPLARSAIDRDNVLRSEPGLLNKLWQDDSVRVLVLWDGKTLLLGSPDEPSPQLRLLATSDLETSRAVEMLTTLAEDVEAGVIGRLTAAPIAAFVAEPIIEEISETFVSIESDDEFEVIEINEVNETVADSEVSLETAPIDVIAEDFELDELAEDDSAAERSGEVDDKTKPIELPEKSDNELF